MIRDARLEDAPAVLALLRDAKLEAEFDAGEFVVAERGERIVGCARLKRLPGGDLELASVAVAPHLRGAGLGAALTRAALARADGGPVIALALAPGFFSRFGFEPLDDAPPALRAKADGFCRSSGFVPMLRRGGGR